MRLFVAIALPDEVQNALERLQLDLGTGRLVPPENMHVTLAFLDQQDLPAAEALHDRLSDIVLPVFDLRISGVDVFDRRAPRLVFAGVGKHATLVALRDKVRNAAQDAGIELRRERFRPHITLARFRHKMQGNQQDRLGTFLEAHGDFSLPPFRVESFGLYRSTLGQDGAHYDLLADYALH